MLEIPGKNLFRIDRNSRGGGLYIYVDSKLSPHTEIYNKSTFVNSKIEILSLNIKKPGFKHLLVSCIY